MTTEDNKRNRTIRWSRELDDTAKRLAAERGMDGGVSELLEQLIQEERDNPRLDLAEPTPGYKAHISQSEALRDAALKRGRKKT